jgi:hypothetical protein
MPGFTIRTTDPIPLLLDSCVNATDENRVRAAIVAMISARMMVLSLRLRCSTP